MSERKRFFIREFYKSGITYYGYNDMDEMTDGCIVDTDISLIRCTQWIIKYNLIILIREK